MSLLLFFKQTDANGRQYCFVMYDPTAGFLGDYECYPKQPYLCQYDCADPYTGRYFSNSTAA